MLEGQKRAGVIACPNTMHRDGVRCVRRALLEMLLGLVLHSLTCSCLKSHHQPVDKHYNGCIFVKLPRSQDFRPFQNERHGSRWWRFQVKLAQPISSGLLIGRTPGDKRPHVLDLQHVAAGHTTSHIAQPSALDSLAVGWRYNRSLAVNYYYMVLNLLNPSAECQSYIPDAINSAAICRLCGCLHCRHWCSTRTNTAVQRS